MPTYAVKGFFPGRMKMFGLTTFGMKKKKNGWGTPLPGVFEFGMFRTLLEKERCRADRNIHAFSVVVFDGTSSPSISLIKVAEVLLKCRRLPDEVGWMEPFKIGVLLPDTNAENSRHFADRVHEVLQKIDMDVPDLIYTYQGNAGEDAMWAPGSKDTILNQKTVNKVGNILPFDHRFSAKRAENLEDLLIQPLPWWKRAMDVLIAGTLLVIIAPFLGCVALLVRITSPEGPVFFVQKRAGAGGRPFNFIKFRTMVPNAEELKATLSEQNECSGPVFKMKLDPRITPLGRVLRKTSIDELPQLWNVLCGDMSLVGPRPPTLDEVVKYDPWHRNRLNTVGGITGIWQVSGRAEIGFEDWMRMDTRYKRMQSFGMDVRLLAKTFSAVFSARGAV
jgi:lipopolysaccharide/colanic/teichoic acid biosynthesis glycosyltransferase